MDQVFLLPILMTPHRRRSSHRVEELNWSAFSTLTLAIGSFRSRHFAGLLIREFASTSGYGGSLQPKGLDKLTVVFKPPLHNPIPPHINLRRRWRCRGYWRGRTSAIRCGTRIAGRFLDALAQGFGSRCAGVLKRPVLRKLVPIRVDGNTRSSIFRLGPSYVGP